MWVICLIRVWQMTRSYVWHGSFLWVNPLTHTCDMTHSYGSYVSSSEWCASFLCVTWLIHRCTAEACLSTLSVSINSLCCRFELQCVAVLCSAVCGVLQCVAVCCSVLQCVAVCCSVLHCVAVCCSVLQCVAVCCSALQWVAVCCSVLQCVAVCSSV